MSLDRFARRLGLVSLGLIAVVACGGAPPPPPTQPAAKPIATEPPAAPVDLSPVAAPSGLVAFARLKKPEQVIKTVGNWTGFPMPGAEMVAELMTGEHVGRLVDLSVPLDVGVVMDESGRSMKPRAAISAGVRSMDEAKGALSEHGKLEAWKNGAFRITGLGPPGEEERDEHACVLAPSVGAASARLVCGDSVEALDALVPYLTRGAPKETTTTDLHITLRTAPVRELVGQLRSGLPALLGLMGGRLNGPPVFREMVEAIVGDGVDLVSDLETVDIDGDLPDAGASLTATAHFRSTTSLLARLATSHPERSDVPPASFWRLPADTDIAFFHRGVDDKDLVHPKQLLEGVLLAAFEEGGLPDASRRGLVDVSMRSLSLLANPFVFGKGVDVPGVQKAQAAQRAVKPGDAAAEEEAKRLLKEQVGGWYLLGYNEPPARLVQPLKDWVAVWNNPKFTAWMKERRGKDRELPTMKLTAAPKGTPKDTTHFEFAIPTHRYDPPTPPGAKPRPKLPPAKPMVLHVLVAPDGAKSWVGFALDANMLGAKMQSVLPGAPDNGTLAKRAGLEALREGKMGAGGFVTLRGVVTGLPIRDALRSEGFGDPFKTISDKQGIVPAPFTLTAEPAGTGTPAFTLRARLSREAVGEVVRFVMRDGRF